MAEAVTETVIIGIGEYRVGRMPMSSIGLGSCIGLIIHDQDRSIGCLAHVMLPESQGKTDRPGKYADTAVETLFAEMRAVGCRQQSLVAKVVGGASMFKNFSGTLNIGERNIIAVRECLKAKGIPIQIEDTGGAEGRTVTYYPGEGGRITVKKADGRTREL
ncbi:MAG: chemotaxis protein CheD [Methanoregulaceae archaeon]|nr:chemotaxis protein CheD [Methanoregulaceae archaeon]